MFLLLAAVLAKTEKESFGCAPLHVSGLGERAPPPPYPEETRDIAVVMIVLFFSVLWWGVGFLLFLCLAIVVFCVFLSVLWWGWVPFVSLPCGCGAMFVSSVLL